MIKNCKICGNVFNMEGKPSAQKTCSDECGRKNREEKWKRGARNYKLKHPALEIKNKRHEYYEMNKESLSKKYRENYLKNREKIIVYVKEYYKGHKEKIKLRAKLHQIKNRDKYNQRRKEMRLANDFVNSDKYFLYALAHRLGIPIGIINEELFQTYKQYVLLKREVRNVKTNSI